MSTFLLIAIIVTSIVLYVILCFVFGELTGANMPLWYEIFTFPLNLVCYPILFILNAKENKKTRNKYEEYLKQNTK